MTSQEVEEGGIIRKDTEEGVRVCVRKGGTEAQRERWRTKGNLLGKKINKEEMKEKAFRKVKKKRKKVIQEFFLRK